MLEIRCGKLGMHKLGDPPAFILVWVGSISCGGSWVRTKLAALVFIKIWPLTSYSSCHKGASCLTQAGTPPLCPQPQPKRKNQIHWEKGIIQLGSIYLECLLVVFLTYPKKSLIPNWNLGLLVSSPFHLLGAGFSYKKKKIKLLETNILALALLGLLK